LRGLRGGEGERVPGNHGGRFFTLAGEVLRYGIGRAAIAEGDFGERRGERLGDFEGGDAPGTGEELHGLSRRFRWAEHGGVKRVGSPGFGLSFVHLSVKERETRVKGRER